MPEEINSLKDDIPSTLSDKDNTVSGAQISKDDSKDDSKDELIDNSKQNSKEDLKGDLKDDLKDGAVSASNNNNKDNDMKDNKIDKGTNDKLLIHNTSHEHSKNESAPINENAKAKNDIKISISSGPYILKNIIETIKVDDENELPSSDPVSDDLPNKSFFPEPSYPTSIESYLSNIYIGTSKGEILHYYYIDETTGYILISRTKFSDSTEKASKKNKKSKPKEPKPILKMLILPSIKKIVVQSGSIISLFMLPELSPANIGRLKDINDFTLDFNSLNKLSNDPLISQQIIKTFNDNHDNFVPVVLFTKKLIRIVLISATSIKLLKDVNYPNVLKGLRKLSYTLVSTETNYDLIDLNNFQKIPLFPLSASNVDNSFNSEILPIIKNINENEFLVSCSSGSNISEPSMGLSINLNGDICRGTLAWSSYPSNIEVDFPFCIAAFQSTKPDTTSNYEILINSLYDQTLLQTISFLDSKILISKSFKTFPINISSGLTNSNSKNEKSFFLKLLSIILKVPITTQKLILKDLDKLAKNKNDHFEHHDCFFIAKDLSSRIILSNLSNIIVYGSRIGVNVLYRKPFLIRIFQLLNEMLITVNKDITTDTIKANKISELIFNLEEEFHSIITDLKLLISDYIKNEKQVDLINMLLKHGTLNNNEFSFRSIVKNQIDSTLDNSYSPPNSPSTNPLTKDMSKDMILAENLDNADLRIKLLHFEITKTLICSLYLLNIIFSHNPSFVDKAFEFWTENHLSLDRLIFSIKSIKDNIKLSDSNKKALLIFSKLNNSLDPRFLIYFLLRINNLDKKNFNSKISKDSRIKSGNNSGFFDFSCYKKYLDLDKIFYFNSISEIVECIITKYQKNSFKNNHRDFLQKFQNFYKIILQDWLDKRNELKMVFTADKKDDSFYSVFPILTNLSIAFEDITKYIEIGLLLHFLKDMNDDSKKSDLDLKTFLNKNLICSLKIAQEILKESNKIDFLLELLENKGQIQTEYYWDLVFDSIIECKESFYLQEKMLKEKLEKLLKLFSFNKDFDIKIMYYLMQKIINNKNRFKKYKTLIMDIILSRELSSKFDKDKVIKILEHFDEKEKTDNVFQEVNRTHSGVSNIINYENLNCYNAKILYLEFLISTKANLTDDIKNDLLMEYVNYIRFFLEKEQELETNPNSASELNSDSLNVKQLKTAPASLIPNSPKLNLWSRGIRRKSTSAVANKEAKTEENSNNKDMNKIKGTIKARPEKYRIRFVVSNIIRRYKEKYDQFPKITFCKFLSFENKMMQKQQYGLLLRNNGSDDDGNNFGIILKFIDYYFKIIDSIYNNFSKDYDEEILKKYRNEIFNGTFGPGSDDGLNILIAIYKILKPFEEFCLYILAVIELKLRDFDGVIKKLCDLNDFTTVELFANTCGIVLDINHSEDFELNGKEILYPNENLKVDSKVQEHLFEIIFDNYLKKYESSNEKNKNNKENLMQLIEVFLFNYSYYLDLIMILNKIPNELSIKFLNKILIKNITNINNLYNFSVMKKSLARSELRYYENIFNDFKEVPKKSSIEKDTTPGTNKQDNVGDSNKDDKSNKNIKKNKVKSILIKRTNTDTDT
ncbi:CORVET complex subunit VPS3 ASCRUDRAFT_69504 [Ascoidea rubescens DSM 1968]|uniref:CNH domain-containing protein n=1 Tax=Ascoidea rubescens DSM 1968 TaxID=1344418 RepID=A0A1D2VJS9_9ASCO|nr:hypothetical protein ASCRUDRAFT_69504 [Ascoidea rubescens DSM 1968]ODV61767.1 hypothetical protein ASCRUDRAFT_69504 [Ascoidea rubescens DSM 1968]